jgi:hypothetical protein
MAQTSRETLMATFSEAVKRWTGTINEWYGIDAQTDEVKKAFSVLKDYRDATDEPGEEPYIETFFKDHNSEWCTGLDTVDREHLTGIVESLRKIQTQTS